MEQASGVSKVGKMSALTQIRDIIAKSDIRHEWRYLTGLTNQTLKEKWNECCTTNKILHHLFLLGDLGEDILGSKKRGKVVYYINMMCIRSYLGFTYSLLFGDYASSARVLRWIYEACLSASAACINGKILTGSARDSGYLGFTKFSNWLRDLDQRKVKFVRSHRKNILKLLGLSSTEIGDADDLYKNLCKHVHISSISFNRRYVGIPDLTLDFREFSKIHRLNTKTMDLSMFAILKSYASIDDIKGFLKSYRSWFYPGTSHRRLLASQFPISKAYVYGQR